MTSPTTATTGAADLCLDRLPDAPERDDMTTFAFLHLPGNAANLARHLGNPETTIVMGDQYLRHSSPAADNGRVPDLLIAFGADREQYQRDNGYIIGRQGKPPDFVLEIASENTGEADTAEKRDYYEQCGVGEYWRFDHTGQYHGARLAADRYVNGSFRPIAIRAVGAEVLEGYSESLKLTIRWSHGALEWIDPRTGEHIPTIDSIEAEKEAEQAGRLAAEAEKEAEREARLGAEREAREARGEAREARARARELETQLAELRRERER